MREKLDLNGRSHIRPRRWCQNRRYPLLILHRGRKAQIGPQLPIQFDGSVVYGFSPGYKVAGDFRMAKSKLKRIPGTERIGRPTLNAHSFSSNPVTDDV